MKLCHKCGLELPETEFSPDRRHTDGLQSQCKKCHVLYGHIYYASHKDKYSMLAKVYRVTHLDAINAQTKKYRLENQDKVHTIYKKYREQNLEKCKAKDKRYKLAHPDARLCYRQNRRARVREALGGGMKPQEWIELKQSYGNMCVYCLKKNIPLEPDHIIPISKGGLHSAENIVPSCRSCNSKKGIKDLLIFLRTVLYDQHNNTAPAPT